MFLSADLNDYLISDDSALRMLPLIEGMGEMALAYFPSLRILANSFHP